MAQTPIFFKKNKMDLDFSEVSITVTDATATDNGQSFVNQMRNRSNSNGWATTGSNDAANTQLDIDFTDNQDIDNLFIVDHNLAAYTIQYWNGSAFTDFSTAINVSGNTDTTNRHSFTSVNTNQLRMIITGTQTADDDKFIAQFIATEILGQLNTKVAIEDVVSSKERIVRPTISGKVKVIKNVGRFSCRMRQNNVKNDADLTLMETLFDLHNGFLVWLSGGDTTQFNTQRYGYRLKDIFLMDILNEYEPSWSQARYAHGMDIDIRMTEAV